MKAQSIFISGIEHPFWYDRDALTAVGARGQYLGDQQKILLDTKLPEATLLRTVLHEALHGIFGNSTLTAGSEAQRELSEDLEEKVVTVLEREIPDLFAANPWLKAVLR